MGLLFFFKTLLKLRYLATPVTSVMAYVVAVTMLKSTCYSNMLWYEFFQTLVVNFRLMFEVRRHPFLLLCSTDNLLLNVSYRNGMNSVTIYHACCMSRASDSPSCDHRTTVW